ncbi:MAG: hypothetical protein KTV45_05160 [Acidimicrobiia bacterium]|nr:hypothetical protein [Acidimicrobiia bacterium]
MGRPSSYAPEVRERAVRLEDSDVPAAPGDLQLIKLLGAESHNAVVQCYQQLRLLNR